MNKKQIKLIGIAGVVVLILNLVLFAFTFTNWIIFWIVLIIVAVFNYKILPKLKD